MTDQNRIEQADTNVVASAATLRHTPVIKALGTLSEVADQPQLMSLCSAVLALGVVTRNGRLARAGARMLAAEIVATAMKSFVKHRIDRTRPHVVDDGGDYEMQPGNSKTSAMSSFPSGHTAGAVAVARSVARDYPELAPSAYGTATAIALIQIPRCKHYPSDLAAGAVVGAAAEAAVTLAEVAVRKFLAIRKA